MYYDYDYPYYVINKKDKKLIVGFENKQTACKRANQNKELYVVKTKKQIQLDASKIQNWSKTYPKKWLW